MQYGFGDFVVLYRTHAQGRPLAEALSRAGIPYQLVGEKPPYVNPAADALISYLAFAMDTSSVQHFQVIFNLPPRSLGETAQKWLELEISNGITPWEILRLGSRNLNLPVRHQAALDSLLRTILSVQKELAILPLPEAVASAWEKTGLRQHFQQSGDSAAESFRWLHILAAMHGDKPAVETLPAFLEDLSQWRAGDFFDSRADAVTLMTMHAAKGLEFPVVFICGLDQDLVPFTAKDLGEETLLEERRLFYVAMTRALHLVVLSAAKQRFLFGELRSCKPSQFIEEIPAHCLEEVSWPTVKKKASKEGQLSLF
jgi:DNA helicase-2/ATP-dependent DNA helicase PcrA